MLGTREIELPEIQNSGRPKVGMLGCWPSDIPEVGKLGNGAPQSPGPEKLGSREMEVPESQSSRSCKGGESEDRSNPSLPRPRVREPGQPRISGFPKSEDREVGKMASW